MIARRKEELRSSGEEPPVSDLLGTLIATEGMNDDLILLRDFELELLEPSVRPHMGATLEPRPGVRMRVRRREPS